MTEENTAEVGGEDVLSAEEQKYFETRGASEELPLEQPKPDAGKDKPVEAKKPEAGKPEDAKAKADEGDEELEFDESGKPKNAGRWVRHGALHAEREQRKAAVQRAEAKERELAEERQRFARLDERLSLLSKAMQPVEEQKGPPDPKEDIFGAVQWVQEQIKGLGGKIEETVKGVTLTREEQQMIGEYKRDVQAFVQQTPDFPQAYNHLFTMRDAQYAAMGVEDPQERARLIEAEEKEIAGNALKSKKSASRIIYDLAKASGYQPRPVADENDTGKDVKVTENGKAVDTAAAEKKIEAIEKASNAGKSLSQAGGTAAELSLAALDAMSEEEFAATVAKMPKSKQREYLGG